MKQATLLKKKVKQKIPDYSKCYICKRNLENNKSHPLYCEPCYAYTYPKDYVRMLTRGKFGKARFCRICKMTIKVEWHHYDYTKPYDVVSLCKECHREADKNRDKSFDNQLGEYWRIKLLGD